MEKGQNSSEGELITSASMIEGRYEMYHKNQRTKLLRTQGHAEHKATPNTKPLRTQGHAEYKATPNTRLHYTFQH
jgi:hypothetical protein